MSLIHRALACALAVSVVVGGAVPAVARTATTTGDVRSGSVGAGSLGATGGTSSSGPLAGALTTAEPFRRAAAVDSGARLVRVENIDGDPQLMQLHIDSPAFGRVVRVGLQVPRDRSAPRPSIQMLDGLKPWQNPGETWMDSAWVTAGGGRDFFRDKNVNVVLTANGGSSFYRDWAEVSPEQGKIAWDTFLATEVTQIIDEHFEGNGVWGIGGLSMGAHAAFMQVARHPRIYSTVVGFSGCYDTSSEFGRAQIRGILSPATIPPSMIFGPEGDPRWEENDPWKHPEAFRDKTVWMSAASGKPGVSDWDTVLGDPASSVEGSLGGGATQAASLGLNMRETPKLDPIMAGGPYEAIAMNCTRRFESFLADQGIPTVTHYEPTGVHAWGLWRDQLPKAWPTMARGLGVVQ